MAIELNRPVDSWNIQEFRNMVERLYPTRLLKGSIFEIVTPIYQGEDTSAVIGIRKNYDNETFSMFLSVSYVEWDFYNEPLETVRVYTDYQSYPLDPAEVDESMFLDFMIFLGETAEMIEG